MSTHATAPRVAQTCPKMSVVGFSLEKRPASERAHVVRRGCGERASREYVWCRIMQISPYCDASHTDRSSFSAILPTRTRHMYSNARRGVGATRSWPMWPWRGLPPAF